MEKTEEKKITEKNENLITDVKKFKGVSTNQFSFSLTKLSNKYTFWFQISQETINNHLKEKKESKIKYESQIKKLSEFDTFEDFWKLYQYIKQPDKCKEGIKYYLFKSSKKPMKEDESNKNGGKLILKCNKGYTSIIWEEIILNLLGDNLPKDIYDKINGIIFSSKEYLNVIEIWFEEYNQNYYFALEENIRKLIQIPKEVPIYFKKIFDEENKNNNDKDYRYEKKYENNKYYNYNNRKYSGYHDNNNNHYYNKNKKYYY